ncbi:hypothetical protein F0562_031226 [Nyssa sinensis]|uniref:C2H2-type domain-containing protein n=1 Tax=Nyssa sinensis TaxID=561372 RepID=A0A5J5ATL6_9ASTE|nr:hypothetical protein F0562_031226 [Nyssa sinensis]
MPVAKLRASTTPDAMKSEEGNNSLNTSIRQAIGKEPFLSPIGKDPFLSFSRTGDSPVQLMQLFHSLDPQDIPGWPLLSPLKVQMQKCDKCSREFCSPINYRRHIRVHRQSLNVDKESHKNRDLLGAFWDKLSLDESKEIVSFKDVTLEEVSGSSIIGALTSLIPKTGFCTLPQVYVKAGSALLGIIQARPSRFPITSPELFSILDDASERTFLSAGTAESMQKYVFDGEAGKIGLEMKNLVACTSFLFEQKLVKAWHANKDAEALRCQKLLVEEEEAAQKRQVELLERKRQKKLRQKERRAKGQTNGQKTDLEEVTADTLESLPSAETSHPPISHESNSDAIDTLTDVASLLDPVQFSNTTEDPDTEAQFGFSSERSDLGPCQNVERQTVQGSGRRHLVIAGRQVPKSQRGGRNGFHARQNLQILKLEPVQKHGAPRDPRAAPAVNGNKVWTRKPRTENDGDILKTRLQKEAINQTDQDKNCEVMIGSISVTLGNCTARQQGDSLAEAQDNNCSIELMMPKKNHVQEKPIKADSVQCGKNRYMVKFWRPVSRHEARGPMPVQSGNQECVVDVITGKSDDRTLPSESCLQSCAVYDNDSESENCSHPPLEDSAQPEGLQFSSRACKGFSCTEYVCFCCFFNLIHYLMTLIGYKSHVGWKEALAGDHVKLVLPPESEPPGCPSVYDDCQVTASSSNSPQM